MQLSQNIRAMSAKGTLDVELEDGRTATLEVDIDLSDPQTQIAVDHEYAEPSGRITVGLGRPLSTTYSIKIPASLEREDGGATWTLRIPVGDDQ